MYQTCTLHTPHPVHQRCLEQQAETRRNARIRLYVRLDATTYIFYIAVRPLTEIPTLRTAHLRFHPLVMLCPSLSTTPSSPTSTLGFGEPTRRPKLTDGHVKIHIIRDTYRIGNLQPAAITLRIFHFQSTIWSSRSIEICTYFGSNYVNTPARQNR